MRTIRRFLRRLIIRLFGGVGETILLPRIRNIYDQLPLYDWRTKKYCANEARRIQKALSKSDFFFRGGGIGMFAIHSRIPYEYFSPIMDDMMWDKTKWTSWQGESQRLVLLDKHQFVSDRSVDVEKIGSFGIGLS